MIQGYLAQEEKNSFEMRPWSTKKIAYQTILEQRELSFDK